MPNQFTEDVRSGLSLIGGAWLNHSTAVRGEEEPFILDQVMLPPSGAEAGWQDAHIATLYFDSGSAEPRWLAHVIFEIIASHFAEAEEGRFVITAYTDARDFRDPSRSNEDLGVERAIAVSRALARYLPTRFERAPEYGGTYPSSSDPAGLASARRVEIHVEDVSGPAPRPGDPSDEEILAEILAARPAAHDRLLAEAEEAARADAEANERPWHERWGLSRGIDLHEPQNTAEAPRVCAQIINLLGSPNAEWTFYSLADVRGRLRIYENAAPDERWEARMHADDLGYVSDFLQEVIRVYRVRRRESAESELTLDENAERLISAVATVENDLRRGRALLKRLWVTYYAMESLSPQHEFMRMREDVRQWQRQANHVYHAALP
jgi:outer membrane protein OmpA-like peptidoglycan-associated protein